MQQKNARITELERLYCLADFDFRTKKISQYEFSKIVLDLLTRLVTDVGTLEPFYTEFKEAAQTEWEKASKAQNTSFHNH